MKHMNSVDRWSKRNQVLVLMLALTLLLLTGCSSTRPSESGASDSSDSFEETSLPGTTETIIEKEASEFHQLAQDARDLSHERNTPFCSADV